ncbi:MAG: YihY/virulence factor BrkB family protein [Clostridia bacterium]|nr:YihY/virulence factor BrkB family protein [Clostridia bacterium]
MKSKVIDLRTVVRKTKTALSIIFNDSITLYSAQASFFIIISTIPFIILLLSLAKYVIDIESLIVFIEYRIDGELGNIIKGLLSEVVGKTGIPLVSLTAVSTLWASSRGVNSVLRGVTEVYGLRAKENFFFDILRSLIYTLAFVLLMIVTLVALVFGRSIAIALRTAAPMVFVIFEMVDTYSEVAFFVVLTLFFAIVYNTCAKKAKRIPGTLDHTVTDKLPVGFWAQVPGAAFSALGWLLFSYIFSLYIAYFPGASYIYGSIATVVFLMLWLYACMIILLLGAEVNKFVVILKNQIKSFKNKK